MGPAPMLALLRDIKRGAYVVRETAAEDYERIEELMDRYSDADIGFVDASVVALAERLREPKIATLDHRHFSIIRFRHSESVELLPA